MDDPLLNYSIYKSPILGNPNLIEEPIRTITLERMAEYNARFRREFMADPDQGDQP